MIAIISSITLAVWLVALYIHNGRTLPVSIPCNPFDLPTGARICWCAVAWVMTFLLVPVGMHHVADHLRFLVLLPAACMVLAGALPIHEDKQGVGMHIYTVACTGVLFLTQMLALLQQPLALSAWVPFIGYGVWSIHNAKEWPAWRLWLGLTAYVTTIFSIFV